MKCMYKCTYARSVRTGACKKQLFFLIFHILISYSIEIYEVDDIAKFYELRVFFSFYKNHKRERKY